MALAWDPANPLARCRGESAAANSAFGDYARMGPRRSLRSLLERFRGQTQDATRTERPPTTIWRTLSDWSSRYDWQARVARFDELQAEAEQAKWEERRAELRERDWKQAEELRELVAAALPHAHQFIHSRRTFVRGKGGEPDQEIITMSFDVTGLARVLDAASKLQRLATDEPTDHVQLSGSALDGLIAAELAKLADQRQAPVAAADPGETLAGGDAVGDDQPDAPGEVRP